MTLPAPPWPLRPIVPFKLPAGTRLHRNHVVGFAGAAFNPCLGQPSRFAPFEDVAGACVPTLYAATSRQAAAFETIFDIEPAAAFKTVRLDVVTRRAVSVIVPARDLLLAALFAPDLLARGVLRAALIDTPASEYGRTVQWARAIHHADARLDGLLWTSRRCDPEQCVVLFGDRLAEDVFAVLERRDVAGDAALLMELRGFGRPAGIAIVS